MKLKSLLKTSLILKTILTLLLISTPVYAQDAYTIETQDENLNLDELVLTNSGDVDSDGINDILVGDPNYDGDGEKVGRVLLFLGKSISENTIDLDKADYIFEGENQDDQAGSSVAFADDEDEDEGNEVVIGFGTDSDPQLVLSSELEDHAIDGVALYEGGTYNTVTVGVSVGASKDVGCSLNMNANSPNNAFYILAVLLNLLFLTTRCHHALCRQNS